MSKENFKSYGDINGVEILRQMDVDGSLSGILFRSDGKLITARHVVELHDLKDFTFPPGLDADFAFRDEAVIDEVETPRLGFKIGTTVPDVRVVTSTITSAENLLEIPGRLLLSQGEFGFGSPLFNFIPDDYENLSVFIPGSSGSPILKGDHIIGLISLVNYGEKQVGAVSFCSPYMKEVAEGLGLHLEAI